MRNDFFAPTEVIIGQAPPHRAQPGIWCVMLVLAVLLWCGVAIAASSVDAQSMLPAPGAQIADEVLVYKSARKLYLLRDGEVLRRFDIMLGGEPNGHKKREGDQRTPEGRYLLDLRNPRSDFFLSIRVSYPNASDRRRARGNGHDPGGQIMIHGLPNDRRYPEHYYLSQDWTDGCIAVADGDMIDIWLMTRENTPIEIRP